MSLGFSSENEKKLTALISRYPRSDAALIPVLWLAQQEFGHLNQEVRQLVAQKVGVSEARVESVVSFYTMFHTEKLGKYHLQICRNLSCSLCGGDELQKVVSSELGIQPGETTPDGLFSYSLVECLAACGGAPALQVNFDYYENVTTDGLKELISSLRKNGKDSD